MKVTTATRKPSRAAGHASSSKAKGGSATRSPGSTGRSEFSAARQKKGPALDTPAIGQSRQSSAGGPMVRAGPMRLGKENWNGKGVEPTPSYFTDLGKPSPLWSELLATPELKRFAKVSDERMMLTLKDVDRNPKGDFNMKVEIYADYQDRRNRTVEVKGISAKAALANLEKDNWGAKPVLPFPLGVYTPKGGGVFYPQVSVRQDPKLLKRVADFFGVSMTTSARSMGEHKLSAIRINDVKVDIYGGIEIRLTPTYAAYNLDDVHDDGVTFPMFRRDAPEERETSRTYSLDELKKMKGRPKMLDNVLAELSRVLG